MITVKLEHPTDPRWLILDEVPNRISPELLFTGGYGKPLLVEPPGVVLVYAQPGGPGTDWVKP